MIEVNNDFKLRTKKIKQQDVKLTIDNERFQAKKTVYSFDGTLFKTIMKQVEITDKAANQLKDKDINFKYGLYINDVFQYVDLGNFYIKDMEDDKKKEEITVIGYDRMIRFMKTFKQSELQLTYPCTIIRLVQKMCEVCEVGLYSTNFFNSDLTVTEDFFTNQEITYRDVLEKIAETTLTTVFIKENKLYFCKSSNVVVQRLDKSYISNLVVKEKFGPLNALVLGRGSTEDNIESIDETSISQNGRCELRFDENEFIQEQREKVIDNMFEQIKGLEYYSYEASDLGVMWLEPCDCIELGDRNDNFYKTFYLKANITINTGITSNSEADILNQANTEYKVTSKEEKKTLKVERLAKKNEGLIQDLIKETTDNTEKIAKHEISIDEISNKVSNITDLTKTVTDTKTITLDNCANGELLQLNIYGNNIAFKPLVLSDDLYLSDSLYLRDVESILIVTDEKGNTNNYDLKVTDTLRQKNNVKDEYALDGGVAKIIRRINQDGSVKDNEEIEDLGELHIVLKQGTNTVEIKDYSAEMQVKWAQKSDLTDTFATKVETNTSISQTSSQIMTEVNKKVDETELGTKIIQDYESVQVAWNKISDFIKMMIFNNNASLCVVDGSNNVIASFDKEGEHFYKSGETTPFGEMGVQTVDNKQYISFSVEGEYDTQISNGMAWGIKTKSDNKFHPIFYISNFKMAEEASDASYGELILDSCNILLNGISTGIIGGSIKMYCDEVDSAIKFINTDTNDILLSISSQDLESGYPKIKILDSLSFFRNSGGTNSFKIGNGINNYALIEDDGSISAYGGTINLGASGNEVSFDLHVKSLASIYGNLSVNGNVYADNISSDRRIKENIKDCEIKALDRVKKIKHKQFDKKDDGKHYDIGYIAQDMEKIDKNFVMKRPATKDIEEKYYINELPLIATLSKAIQEQQEMIEQLQTKIKKMEDELNGIN